MEMERWPESSVLAGLVVALPLLFFDDDGVTSWPSVDGSVIGGASELGPTCNTMLRLVARQVLERLICECIVSGSLDVDGDDDRAFKFRPFGRNWMAKLTRHLLERHLYRRRGRYICFVGSLWTGCCWRRR
ncbi:uncharacterized protein LOC117189645 [Drosophila miranda]|uniref:uncharacterized protein LOC117189645 n=1 Tax=Drosophila miranda TaxID=7229 RepID=UPI00143F2CB1|nr:uncharacterized protein LOC117189645 [Drosophila miranda]